MPEPETPPEDTIAVWERDPKWWWGWHDCWSVGITWMDSGYLHVRGVFFGPLRVYWEKWDGPVT